MVGRQRQPTRKNGACFVETVDTRQGERQHAQMFRCLGRCGFAGAEDLDHTAHHAVGIALGRPRERRQRGGIALRRSGNTANGEAAQRQSTQHNGTSHEHALHTNDEKAWHA